MDETKDRRINVRLDEDTFFALKKIVEEDLKTDISTYCRSLIWISTLHDATLHRLRNSVKQFNEKKDFRDLEYMLTIKNEIEFIETFLTTIRENRKKYDDFISMIEKWHESIRSEARNYFVRYNEILEAMEKDAKDSFGEDYEKNPTRAKWWGNRIDI